MARSSTRFNFEGLTYDQKYQAIKNFKEFLVEYELKNRKLYSSYKIKLHLFSIYAATGDPCLFGGWPSVTDHNNLCFRPQKKNLSYKQYANKCGVDELYCNPTLFGRDICVDFSTSSQRKSAYQNCNNKFEKIGRTVDEVIIESDDKQFINLAKSVESVCNYAQQSVSGMCKNLRYKLRQYIQDDSSLFVRNLVTAKNASHPDDVMNALGNAGSRMEELSERINGECDSSSLSRAKLLECQKIGQEFTSLEKYTDELLKHIENNDSTMYRKLVCGYVTKGNEVDSFAQEGMSAAAKASCSPIQKKVNETKCAEEIKCSAISTFATLSPMSYLLADATSSCNVSVKDSCLTNVIMGIAKNITDLLSGVWGLVEMAAEWVSDKAGDFWDWVTNVEDISSDKQLAVAGLSEENIDEIAEDPRGFFEKMWDGIKGSFDKFLKEGIFCEQWSGVPQYSQCQKPMASFDCLSCRTKVNGYCTAAGYLVPEILMVITTGGLGNFVKSGVKGASVISKALKASSQYGKIVKAAAKNPLLKVMGTGAKVVVKSGKVIRKYGGKAFQGLVDGIKAIGRAPGIKQTRTIIGKISQKTGEVIGKTKAAQAVERVKTKMNDSITKAGVKLEESANRVANKITPETAPVAQATSKSMAASAVTRASVKASDDLKNGVRGSGRDNYSFDTVNTNASRTNKADRLKAIESDYANLSPRQRQGIYDAHTYDRARCIVYKCTPAQLREKMKIMEQAGVPQDIARDAIRRGHAGDSARIMKADELSDMREDMLFQIKKSDDITENTNQIKAYYQELRKQKIAIDSGNSVSRGIQGSVKNDLVPDKYGDVWIDDYIKRQEAAGNIEKGTLSSLKSEALKVDQVIASEVRTAETVAEVTRQKFSQKVTDDTRKYRDSDFYSDESFGLSDKNVYNQKTIDEAQTIIDELNISEKRIRDYQKELSVMPHDGNVGNAKIQAESALKNIKTRKRVLEKKIEDINNINEEYVEVMDATRSQYFKPRNVKDILEESPHLTRQYQNNINNQLIELRKLEQRKAAGTISNADVAGIESADISGEIQKLEELLKSIE